MYEFFTEHKFNSILPKHTAKANQRIRKARSRFATIPRLNKKVSLLCFSLKVPQPDYRIQPQTHSCRSFRSFAFPNLRFLSAEQLFCILESILDAPATCETANDLDCDKIQICGEEKIVFFLSHRVSADNQQYRLLRDSVPYNFSGIDKAFSLLACFAGLNPLPVGYSPGQFFWAGKLFAFLARSASCLFSFLARQIVNVRISTYSGDYMRMGYALSCQRSVKTIAMAQKSPFRKPQRDFCKHLAGQFYEGWPVLSVQSHVDRQTQRFAAQGGFILRVRITIFNPHAWTIFVPVERTASRHQPAPLTFLPVR